MKRGVDPYRIRIPFGYIVSLTLTIYLKSFSTPAISHKRKDPESLRFQGLRYVEMGSKSSKPVKDYLKRFWEYYTTSPQLQKALANA